MEKSSNINELSKALCQFQLASCKVKKDSINPFFKSKYASLSAILDAISEPLAKNNLSFVQFPEDQHGLTTILMHESGQFIQSTYFMTPTKNTPQEAGSVITYQRRYALGAILGLNIDEDDDANKASQPVKKKSVPSTPKKKLSVTEAKKLIESSTSIDELTANWKSIGEHQKNEVIINTAKEIKSNINK